MFDNHLGDEAVQTELGNRLAQQRVALELTQAELARQAGVGKRTLERMETGSFGQVTSLIRVLRVLRLLGRLEQLVPEVGPRPMDLLREKGKRRRRAAGKRRRPVDAPDGWTWGDES